MVLTATDSFPTPKYGHYFTESQLTDGLLTTINHVTAGRTQRNSYPLSRNITFTHSYESARCILNNESPSRCMSYISGRSCVSEDLPCVRHHHVWCIITMNHLNAKRNIGALLRQPYLMIVFSTSNSPWLVLLALLQTLHLRYSMYTTEGVL